MDFFITRPILATALALVMILAGAVAGVNLPIAQYPPIAPPEVEVTATYPGASAQVVADSVTTPLEEQINGAQDMIYMSSQSANDGQSVITATFEVGTDPRIAQVEVQNRASWALPELPDEVQHGGVIVEKTSSDLLLGVNLLSPKGTYDTAFLGNYANIHIRDTLSRIPGVAQVVNFGLQKYAMRVWIDPGKLTNLGLTASDVNEAIRNQNTVFGAGTVGQAPAPPGQPFTRQLTAKGRLDSVEEFETIILRANPDGSVVRIKDVARVELGAEAYIPTFKLNNEESCVLGVFLLAGANAFQVSTAIEEEMERQAQFFPDDLTYVIPYNTALFVRASVNEVLRTLAIAIVLVVVVVYVFLQSWRATIIPSIAIPVALIGTLAIMQLFGFSLNSLSLLGLVLAVGLVVDDAIVVVENIERRLGTETGSLVEITRRAMHDVRGPILASTTSLVAVFAPVSFMPGLTGQLYHQFSMTIAVSVFLSGVNSMTFTPALAAFLLRPRTREPHAVFRVFNRVYGSVSERYSNSVERFVRWRWAVIAGFFALCGIATLLIVTIPSGFVPEEDQGYFMVTVQGPHASTLEQTREVTHTISEELLKFPNVTDTVAVTGYSLLDGIDQPNSAIIWVPLKNWRERTGKETTVQAIIKKAQKTLDAIPGAETVVINAPAIPGLAATGGLDIEIQDRNSLGTPALAEAASHFIERANALPEIEKAFTTFDAGFPQRYLDIDRTKAKSLGVSINDLFDTIQINMGSFYVNNFNKFGRVYDVYVQAEANARATDEDILNLRVRNEAGDMIRLSSLVEVKPVLGPYALPHYNLYPSVSVNAVPSAGHSIGDAKAAMEKLADQVLPRGFGYSWTSTVYQEIKTGNLAPVIFTISLVFVFLVLAMLFESWTLPVAILLSVPVGLLGAVGALYVRGMDLDVFGQIGLVMLIGLTAKNAILIVQFAQDNRAQGESILRAATMAARTRLRPILMTAFAFILGVTPLAFATGAGAHSRQSMGTTVAGGMIVATVLIVIVPVFYAVIETWRERAIRKHNLETAVTIPPEGSGSRNGD